MKKKSPSSVLPPSPSRKTYLPYVLLVVCLCLSLFLVLFSSFSSFGSTAFPSTTESYQRNDKMIHTIKEKLHKVIDKKILDGCTFTAHHKSLTENKKHVKLCLYDENGEYYHPNMLMYVALHEMAHVLNPTIGHDDSFHRIFDALLEKAESHGIYHPQLPHVHNYCTHTLRADDDDETD